MTRPPVVLVVGGHDPSGGAGIVADGEAVRAAGGHPLSLITTLTVQDSHRVYALAPTSPALLQQQFAALRADLPVDAIKVGMLGSVELVTLLLGWLDQLPGCPLVVDPVLAAGGGGGEASAALRQALASHLLPRTTLLTPNSVEAQRLSGRERPAEQAEVLLELGCSAVLITGTHEAGEGAVTNRLFRRNQPPLIHTWPRLPADYHGSGCTLAAAIAVRLAAGQALAVAVAEAERYTWSALHHGYSLSDGQYFPARAVG